jgi:citrate lyase subunit beta/citryl-CoA lyase
MEQVRSVLYLPASNARAIEKARNLDCDAVILDLEDAVGSAEKPAARAAVARYLNLLDDAQCLRLVVRINDALSAFHSDDLAWLKTVPPHTVMLSKCESAPQVARVLEHMRSGADVIALIETARGVLAVQSIANASGISRLAFGSIDFMLDLDLPGPGFALDTAATAIVMASRAAGLEAPIAGVTPDLDAVRVSADLQHARALGYGAKMCIHPSQVIAVNAALQPAADELAWAQRILFAWQAADNTGAIQVDGQMVDKPVVLRAQRIVARATPVL